MVDEYSIAHYEKYLIIVVYKNLYRDSNVDCQRM